LTTIYPKNHMFSDERAQIQEVLDYLPQGQVVILMESGAQSNRYVTGNAVAMRRIDGVDETIQVNIDDIYTKVHQTWGTEPTVAYD